MRSPTRSLVRSLDILQRYRHGADETTRFSRLRMQGPWRGSPPHRRGRCHDPHKGFVSLHLHFSLPTHYLNSGEAGTGNIIEAVRHARMVNDQIRRAKGMNNSELYNYAKELSAPYELLKQVAEQGRLPVVMFSAGGIATPADAAVSAA
jgi:hypothetical protein